MTEDGCEHSAAEERDGLCGTRGSSELIVGRVRGSDPSGQSDPQLIPTTALSSHEQQRSLTGLSPKSILRFPSLAAAIAISL